MGPSHQKRQRLLCRTTRRSVIENSADALPLPPAVLRSQKYAGDRKTEGL